MEYVRRAEGLGYAASEASITSMFVVLLVRFGAIFSRNSERSRPQLYVEPLAV
jgi:hypothetical protein